LAQGYHVWVKHASNDVHFHLEEMQARGLELWGRDKQGEWHHVTIDRMIEPAVPKTDRWGGWEGRTFLFVSSVGVILIALMVVASLYIVSTRFPQ
jgi:hypothetical protein